MKLLTYFLVFFWCASAFSQINTDRPTQSFSPFVMPKGGVQIEAGFLSEKPSTGLNFNVVIYNALLRFGVTEKIEFRVTQNYIGIRSDGSSLGDGFSPTTLGTKIQIIEQAGWVPQIGLIGSITLTNGDDLFAPLEPIQDVRLLFQNDLTELVALAYNYGVTWQDGESLNTYSITVGYSVSGQVGLFIEPYGFFGKNFSADHRLNGGVTYLVSDNFQLDFSGGNGISQRSPDFFISFGLSALF